MARSMLTMSRELIVPRKNEVLSEDVNDNLEALRALLPDDFRDPRKDENKLPIAIKRWKKLVRKISLAKKFLFNLQESDRIRRYVTVISHGLSSLLCLPLILLQQSTYALVQAKHVDVEPYEGFPEALKFIYERGITRILRGFGCVWLETNLPLVFKELLFPSLARKFSDSEGKLSGWKKILSDVCSLMISYAVVIPLSFLRTRLVVQNPNGTLVYRNTFDCIQKVIAAEGISAFFPLGSICAHLVDDVCGLVTESLPLPSLLNVFLRIVDVVCVGIPLMSIDTRLFSYNSPYKGFFDCAQRVVKEEGIHGFYKGIDSLLWIIPPTFFFSYLDNTFQRFLWRYWLDYRRNKVEEAEFLKKVQRIQTGGIFETNKLS